MYGFDSISIEKLLKNTKNSGKTTSSGRDTLITFKESKKTTAIEYEIYARKVPEHT